MSEIVGTSQLKDAIRLLTILQESKIRIPLLIHGKHGIGKTEIVKQTAKSLDYNCVELHLSTQEPCDLLGLPDKSCGTHTSFLCPDWLYHANSQDKPTIFFLDEINRAPMMVQQVMFPFVLNGTIHTHSIKPNDIIVAAMNPDTEDYSVEDFNDKALISRFCNLYFEPPIHEWADYCKGENLHKSFLDSMSYFKKLVGDVSVEKTIRPEPDRRNLFKIGKALSILKEEDVYKCKHLFSGMIGAEHSGFILKQYRSSNKVDIENIFNGTIKSNGGSSIDVVNLGTDIIIDYLCYKLKITAVMENNKKAVSFKYLFEDIEEYKKIAIRDWISGLNEDVAFRMISSIKSNVMNDSDIININSFEAERYRSITGGNEVIASLYIISLFETLDVTSTMIEALRNA